MSIYQQNMFSVSVTWQAERFICWYVALRNMCAAHAFIFTNNLLFRIPVWIQSLFGVFEKQYGFAEYSGFGKLRGVWMQQIL